MSVNQVVLLGNLARDVNLHEDGKTPFCNMTVVTNDGWGDNEITSFIPVKAFGKTAENCAKFLSKGSKVAVTGRIQTGSYEKKDGTKVYTTEVIAFRVEFLHSINRGENQIAPNNDVPTGFHEVEDDDIPFN